MSNTAWDKHAAAAVKLWHESDRPDDPAVLAKIMFALFLAHEHARHEVDTLNIRADIHQIAQSLKISYNAIIDAGKGFGRFDV